MVYSFTIVLSGLQVNLAGYKKYEDAVEALKCVDYLDKKRIESAFYYPKSKPDTRVGIITPNAKTQELKGFASHSGLL